MSALRCKKKENAPEVMSHEEVKQMINFIGDTSQLIVKLLYEIGLQLKEAVRLWGQDIDYELIKMA